MARGRQKQLDRMEKLAKPEFIVKPVLHFRDAGAIGQNSLVLRELQIGYDCPLLPPISLSMLAGQKTVVCGFNGIGKSTLLNTLVGKIPKLGGSFRFADAVIFGHLEQDLLWPDGNMTPLQIVGAAFPNANERERRKMLAQCAVQDDHVIQPISTLSGGEQCRVRLCILCNHPTNFLILDEPTNHLDAETKQALQRALIEFPGSILLVTHEMEFCIPWADQVINLEDRIRRSE